MYRVRVFLIDSTGKRKLFLIDETGERQPSLNLLFDVIPRIGERICVHNDFHAFWVEGTVINVTYICSVRISEISGNASDKFLGDRDWVYQVFIKEGEEI